MRRVATQAGARKTVQPKGRQRAQEILRAARALLVENGYAALTTRKVAERAGVRQSNLQYYFPTKVDLVRALFESSVSDSMRPLVRMVRARLSPERRLSWAVDQFLQSHQSLDQQVFLRELWALAAHDPAVAGVMNGFYRRWIDLTTKNLLEITPALGLRRAQRHALLIISLVDGLSLFHGAAGVDHPAVAGIERDVRAVVLALARDTLGR
jgi:AcrR family transcriptional regulator